MVTMAQIASAKATANTPPPTQIRGTDAGTNRNGYSQSAPIPARIAIAHAIGGRTIAFDLSGLSLIVARSSDLTVSFVRVFAARDHQVVFLVMHAERQNAEKAETAQLFQILRGRMNDRSEERRV